MDEGAGMQDCVHQAAGDSSRALRAVSEETPCPEPTLLSCPRCGAVWALRTEGHSGDPQQFLNVRSKTWCGWCEHASVGELVPAEYVSAPARADLGMVDAAIRCSNEWSRGLTDFASLYRAMLDAAPQLPLQSQGREVPTGHSLNSEAAKPLASSGPNEPTPASLLLLLQQAAEALERHHGWEPCVEDRTPEQKLIVELRQRMGRE